eukprot:Pgem_evm1s18797
MSTSMRNAPKLGFTRKKIVTVGTLFIFSVAVWLIFLHPRYSVTVKSSKNVDDESVENEMKIKIHVMETKKTINEELKIIEENEGLENKNSLAFEIQYDKNLNKSIVMEKKATNEQFKIIEEKENLESNNPLTVEFENDKDSIIQSDLKTTIQTNTFKKRGSRVPKKCMIGSRLLETTREQQKMARKHQTPILTSLFQSTLGMDVEKDKFESLFHELERLTKNEGSNDQVIQNSSNSILLNAIFITSHFSSGAIYDDWAVGSDWTVYVVHSDSFIPVCKGTTFVDSRETDIIIVTFNCKKDLLFLYQNQHNEIKLEIQILTRTNKTQHYTKIPLCLEEPHNEFTFPYLQDTLS